MEPWVVGSIRHGGPIDLFHVLHDWYNKDRGMCYSVYEIGYFKDLLLLIGKSSPFIGASRLPLRLSDPLAYVR